MTRPNEFIGSAEQVEVALRAVQRRGRRGRRRRRRAVVAAPFVVSAIVAGMMIGARELGPHHVPVAGTTAETVEGTWASSMHGHFHVADSTGAGVNLSGRWVLHLGVTTGTLNGPRGDTQVTLTRSAGTPLWRAVGPAGSCRKTAGLYHFVPSGNGLHGALVTDRCLLRTRLLETAYHQLG